MVLGFGQSKAEDVAALIAKKNYGKAIEVIKAQLLAGRPDPRLRLQLADAMISAGKSKDAVGVLIPLADEYAREGFAAKAVSVLKRIQKIDPGRRDVDGRLANLIQSQQRVATVSLPPPAPALEIGIEEIGFAPPEGGPVVVPAGDEVASLVVDEPTGFEMAPAPPSRPPEPPPRPRPAATPVVDRDLVLEEVADADEVVPMLSASDLVLVEPEGEAPGEPEVEAAGRLPASPMSDAAFAEEVLGLLEDVFPSADLEPGDLLASVTPEPPETARPIVVSPLFKDFSVDETMAVIQGLRLITCEPGEIIITQGDPGSSLYILTSGKVKAFVRNAEGRQAQVGVFGEGAFFGEISILTGKPRAATIVAASRAELLELDRKTLDSITKKHPHVWQVLEEFARQRTAPKA
jgi:hypothetical protein